MVLIGAYHDSKDDRYWFVLQNTHRDGLFELVDGEHLAPSDAKIIFACKDVDMSLKGNHEVSGGEYIETETELAEIEECIEEETIV